MQVVIPIASPDRNYEEGSRLIHSAFALTKMGFVLELILSNFDPDSVFYIGIRAVDVPEYTPLLKEILGARQNVKIIEIRSPTQGAADTVYQICEALDVSDELFIANADQYIVWDYQSAISELREHDGGLLTFNSSDPKNCFIELGPDGLVFRLVEKEPISEIAATGIYYWKHAKLFKKCFNEMYLNNETHNGLYYICPSYNAAIRNGLTIATSPIKQMWNLSTKLEIDLFNQRFLGN